VAGFGWAGQDLVKRIRKRYSDRVEIVAACNRGEERLKVARDQFGLRVTHDCREMCGWDVDFVAVMSTSFAHTEQVLAAAEAGKALFVEKPIALNLADADRMIEAVESRRLVNVVNYSMRYAPRMASIKKLIDEGFFGEIKGIYSDRWRGRDFWANGMRYKVMERPQEFGTWLVHHMCHSLDMIYWLAGPIDEIYCVTNTTKPASTDEEIMWACGRLASGATFAVSDAGTGMVRETFGLQGLKRSLVLEGTAEPVRVLVKEEGKQLQVGEPFELPPADNVKDSVDHLMEVLLEGKPSRATLRDARHSLAAAIAAKKSSLENRPVKLAELGEL
jgi:predicted dehydrogenase